MPNMMLKAIANLDLARLTLNHINVFPVPDGDTGTNMYLTVNSCIDLIGDPQVSSEHLLSNIADNIFLNSKGNSGVILSSFLHGCLSELSNSHADNPITWINGFQKGYTKAYASIGEPKEGTMLSVMKSISDINNYPPLGTMQLSSFWEEVTKTAWQETQNTANSLPELQAAEVIDSGAAGLTVLLYSFAATYNTNSQGTMLQEYMSWLETFVTRFNEPALSNYLKGIQPEQWGYCCQGLISSEAADSKQEIQNTIESFEGVTSLVVSQTPSMCKIHFHALHPEIIFNALQIQFDLVEQSTEDMDNQVGQHSNPTLAFITEDPKTAEMFEQGGHIVILMPSPGGAEKALRDLQTHPQVLLVSTSSQTAKWLRAIQDSFGIPTIALESLPEALMASTFFNEQVTVETNISDISEIIDGITMMTFADNLQSDATPENLKHEIQKAITSASPLPKSLITVYLGRNIHHLTEIMEIHGIATDFPDYELQIHDTSIPGILNYITME